MKNREYRTLVAIAIASVLVVGSIGVVPSAAAEKETQKIEKNVEDSSEAALKDETVYVKTDRNGTIKSVTVSDQLRNVKDISQIQDLSSLKEIENIKGEEKFTKSGEKMFWKGNGKNIFYQGTTTEKLPVNVKISYWLDGKEIKADELEGKSGRLVIRYQYENTTKTLKTSYTPFLMATGVILDDEKFSDIKVTNGKVISDGERNVVIGMGIPNMKEELGVDDLDIPDYFEIEADVTNYEAVEGMTIATNQIFNEIDIEKFDDLSDLENAVDELQKASERLVNGSGELKKGLDTLLTSSGTLVSGIVKLEDGGKELKSGTNTLMSGSSELAEGNKALADGTGQLLAGTKQLKSGAGELNTGLKMAADKTKNILLPGVKQLDDGVTQMQNEMTMGIGTLGTGMYNLNVSLEKIQEGTGALNAIMNHGTAQTGGVSLKGLAAQTVEDAKTLVEGAAGSSVTMSAAEVAQGNGGTDEAVQILNELLNSESVANDPALQAAVSQAAAKLSADMEARKTAAANMDAQIKAASANTALMSKVAQEAGTVSAVVNNMSSVVSDVDAGMGQAKAGAAQLDYAVNDRKEGLGVKVTSGIGTLKQGTSALRGGIDGSEGLADGLGKLSAGAAAVSSGSDELSRKMKEADAGAKGAAKGASQIMAGTKRLNSGASELYSGLYTLKAGTGELIDGVKKLDAGADELNRGMMQFDEDGIKKLVKVFDGDIENLLDKLNDMLSASKAYKNFSGISNEMDGQVKFVFVTE